MSEKVLGFYEKDAKLCQSKERQANYRFFYDIYKKDLVSVRLASESVDLKTLKEFCKENYLPYNQDICNLIEWAEKEAKKQVGEKK